MVNRANPGLCGLQGGPNGHAGGVEWAGEGYNLDQREVRHWAVVGMGQAFRLQKPGGGREGYRDTDSHSQKAQSVDSWR